MIYYQEQNVDLQFFSWGDVQFFFASTGTVALPYVGIWQMIINTEQVVYLQDYTDILCTGDIRPIWVEATTAAAVADIILERGFHRFLFGRMFGRVN